MNLWIRTLIGVAVISAVAFVGSLLSRPPDPVYKGKALSVWLQDYDRVLADIIFPDELQTAAADEAVSHIGTNAIPMLFTMLRAKDSAVTLGAIRSAKKMRLIGNDFPTAKEKNFQACKAFRALGANASNAVPELIKMYNHSDSADGRNLISYALGNIGPAAISAGPLLLKTATDNKDEFEQVRSLWALSRMNYEPATVIPALKKFLSNQNTPVCATAVDALGRFGSDAKSESSDILVLFWRGDWFEQRAALIALSRIYSKPEWYPKSLHEWLQTTRRTGLIHLINDFGEMGTNAKPVVPALIKLSTDPDKDLQASAIRALNAIGPDSTIAR